jgi:hypothetical protein
MNRLMVGRAMGMLLDGSDEDPQAGLAGVLTLACAVPPETLLATIRCDFDMRERVWHVGGDRLPLTPFALKVLADYYRRVPALSLDAPLFLATLDRPMSVLGVKRRVARLTGGWFTLQMLRDWAMSGCDELSPDVGVMLVKILDQYSAKGATLAQRAALRRELEGRRRLAIEDWHGCLAWCASAIGEDDGGEL